METHLWAHPVILQRPELPDSQWAWCCHGSPNQATLENQISRIGWLDMLDFLATTRGDDPNFEYVTMFFFVNLRVTT